MFEAHLVEIISHNTRSECHCMSTAKRFAMAFDLNCKVKIAISS